MLKRIVGKNTLFIRWRIYKNGRTIFENPKVVLIDTFKKEQKFEYTVEDFGTYYEVNGIFEGKNQFTYGVYSLLFFNNYGEDNQNCLVYNQAFVLIHAAKRGLQTFGDENADQAVLVELNSDLSVSLINQEIQDSSQIIQYISDLTLINDEQNQRLNDLSTHLDSSLMELTDRIDNLSIDSIDEIIQAIEDNEQVLVNYLAIIDNSVNEQKELIENNSNTIDDVSTRLNNFKDNDFDVLRTNIYNVSTYVRNVSTQLKNVSTRLNTLATEMSEAITYDDTELVQAILDLSTSLNEQTIAQSDNLQVVGGRITNVSTRVIDISTRIKDVSTRLNGLSQVVDNLVDDPGYDDSVLKQRVTDVSSKVNDLSTYAHGITIPESYDDSNVVSRIQDISSYSINVSSRLNDLSTFAHNITPGTTPYDDSNIKSRIADVSQYSINVSTKINDLSTYTHNLVIPNEYDDTEIKSRIADVSQYSIDISTDLAVQKTYITNTREAQSQCSTEISNLKPTVLDLSTRVNVLEQSGGSGEVDLTDVNSSISDLSTRINQLERAEYATNPFYYTPFDVLSKGVSSFNTSSFLFHDVIVNVSSLQSNSAASSSNWGISLFDTVASTTGHWVHAKRAYASTPPKNFVSYNNLSIDVNKYGTYIGTSVNGITGKFYAYHFPHLMKIVSQNSSVPDVSNQVSFRIEDPS